MADIADHNLLIFRLLQKNTLETQYTVLRPYI